MNADLQSYFDTIPKEPLLVLVKERVSDGDVLALAQRFLEQDNETGYEAVYLTAYDSSGKGIDLITGYPPLIRGVAAGSVVIPTGVAVRPGKVLCVTSFRGVSGGRIHGFFADDR